MSQRPLRLSYKLDKLHSSLWMPDVFVVYSSTRTTALATTGQLSQLCNLGPWNRQSPIIPDPTLLFLWEFNIIVFFPVLHRINSIILNEYLIPDQDTRSRPSLSLGYHHSIWVMVSSHAILYPFSRILEIFLTRRRSLRIHSYLV